MVEVCPRCGGHEVGCPICNLPPRRELPKADIFKGTSQVRKAVMLYGALAWEVQAVDLSYYNASMNFAITKQKCQAVILRYGYGNQWKDPKLDEYYAGAKAQGMPIGAYWYKTPRAGCDPVVQANSFADLIATHPVDLDIHNDVEESYLTKEQTLAWVIANEDRLQARTGRIPLPYSSKNFWDNKVAYSTRWANRKTWPANWTVRDYPVVPNGWTFVKGDWWQWSANGNNLAAAYGSTGGDTYMDLDRWFGTVVEFNARYNTNIKPIGTVQPPPAGQVPENVIINTGELSIHDTPQAVQTNVVGHALYNTTWHPYSEVTANGIAWYVVGKDLYISKAYTRLP